MFLWFLRRDSEAGGTRMGGWVTQASNVISPTVGVYYGVTTGLIEGITTGLAAFILMWCIRVCAGWLDLRIGVTNYTVDYISSRAPAKVKLMRK